MEKKFKLKRNRICSMYMLLRFSETNYSPASVVKHSSCAWKTTSKTCIGSEIVLME